jgi:hypothetical protein
MTMARDFPGDRVVMSDDIIRMLIICKLSGLAEGPPVD